MATCLEILVKWRTLLVVILTPLLLLPLPIVINTSEGKAAFVLFLMAVYWVTEAVPIAVTSLLPVFLFPMMDIMPAKVVAKSYMSDLIMLFLGGLLVAVSIERWNLHRRIALRILLLFGAEPRWLMLGMMVATWFLSMWISNTATTAMMVPITEAILQQLKGTLIGDNQDDQEMAVKGESLENGNKPQKPNHTSTPEDTQPHDPVKEKSFRLLCKGMSLSICYAANSGGIATLTGTGPNLVLKENADKLYKDHNLSSPVNFATWMGYGLPLSAIVLVICWIWLQIAFLRCRGLSQCCSKSEEKEERGRRVKAIILREYRQLGPVSFAEKAVLTFFCLLVVLWVTRDLGGVGGWGDLFVEGTVSDSTPAILIGVCLFFFPSRNPFRSQVSRTENYSVNGVSVETEQDDRRIEPLLQWSDAHTKIPWSLFLLLGGGFALSDGCKVSGLSAWIGEQLEVFSDVDKVGMLFILCYITAAMTEITSNTAISIILLPILSSLALKTGIHPLYYMFPTTLACSFAFMLPVATPPNAIVFSYGHIRVVDMMLAGVVMNIACVPVLILATNTWGNALFDFDTIPANFVNTTGLVSAS